MTHTTIGRWGYDEISWFARLSQEQRADFLRYAHRWTRHQRSNWFFQPPLCRQLDDAAIDSPAGRIDYYRANITSDACPLGFGDEDAILYIWDDPGHIPMSETENPEPPLTPEGVLVPTPVTVVGELQAHLGGISGDASCPWSRLFHQGNGIFERTFILPLAGTFSFAIAVGGSMSDLTKEGGIAGGPPFRVTIPRAGHALRVRFDYDSREVTITC